MHAGNQQEAGKNLNPLIPQAFDITKSDDIPLLGGKDLTGAVLLGVAVGLILVSMTSTAVSGTIVACIAFALGWFNFRSSQKEAITVKKEESKPVNTIKGGAEKWW